MKETSISRFAPEVSIFTETCLSYLHPIEPLVLVAAPGGDPCVDRGSDCERRELALVRDGIGLPSLIGHPAAPREVVRGVSDGFYAPVAGRGVFLHREDYLINGSVSKTRWSIICGLDPDVAPVSPVMTVPRDAVEATIEHLNTAGVDPGGITALYRDEEHILDKLVAARGEANPLVQLKNPAGGVSSLWLLSDEEGAGVLRLIEKCGSTLVGDVAAFRAIQRLRNEERLARESYPIVNFFNQRDFGVTFAACVHMHTLEPEFDLNGFIAALHNLYDVTEVPIDPAIPVHAYDDFFDCVRTEGITQKVVGLIIGGLETVYTVRVREGQLPPGLSTELPDAVLEYDVEWMRRGIVERLLEPSSATPTRVLSDPRQLGHVLPQDRTTVALILNPPPKRHIPDLARLGWQLPFGALQLKPAVPRGLLMVPLR